VGEFLFPHGKRNQKTGEVPPSGAGGFSLVRKVTKSTPGAVPLDPHRATLAVCR
jgi:hypothetical protein